MDKNAGKIISRNLSGKYSQKIVDHVTNANMLNNLPHMNLKEQFKNKKKQVVI